MRIRRLKPIAVRLPLRRPVKMASEVVSAAENVLVRLETADGIVGWGEAASAPTMTGETVATMVRAIAELAPLLSDTEDAHAVMHWLPGNHGAKAAIDIALHDAMGKAAGKPVCELLGGVRRSRVALMWTLASDVAEQQRDHVERAGDQDDRRAGSNAEVERHQQAGVARHQTARGRDQNHQRDIARPETADRRRQHHDAHC